MKDTLMAMNAFVRKKKKESPRKIGILFKNEEGEIER